MLHIQQPDPMSKFRGQQRIMVSLEKGFGSKEIWATVLSRDYLGMYIFMSIFCVRICTFVYLCIYVCAYIYIYICIYLYTYIHIYRGDA
jgi:hypothetical protein